MDQQRTPDEKQLDDVIRRALKTPPISNEEIERRSKASHGKPHKPQKETKKGRSHQ